MKRFVLAAAAALTATGAYAGDLSPAQPEAPVVVATPAPVSFGGDWTGAYGGLSYGNLSAQSAGASDNDYAFGGHVGYDYDFGDWVVGGEYEYQDGGDVNIAGVDVDNVQRLKLRGGYDLGQALIYGTVGAARIDTSIGDDTGAVGGVGLEYKVTDNFTIGGEVLAHDFNDLGGADAEAQTFNMRASFRF
ncbi:outer membrane protein [Tropicibacter naphthalenivorans]|uniref:Opacity protein antigens n=1 Tax=Tropicibacter naphthalenivorans TaxID=441103 RepID=A0A0P1GG02_9RHOB|nr:porin family protein [Tropicibacter naphthalenivorans]CUH80493.1 Opacity protein antigens [Tropicibacter naphthalenivorans]SMC87059.1 Outer membrane protein beta-barrel domain-containing protein [Tropicibacter naphthalenivorans]